MKTTSRKRSRHIYRQKRRLRCQAWGVSEEMERALELLTIETAMAIGIPKHRI